MNIAIYGSCVSRDTCEYMPDATVEVYVARQSVVSLLSPHGIQGVEINLVDSPFQRRMLRGDLQGNGIDQLAQNASSLDLVLIDLIDERRGFWLFPNGTTMTNSLEAEASGLARQAMSNDAYLVEFGTDQHFEMWRSGFESLVMALNSSRLIDRAILLDVEWAQSLEGVRHPPGVVTNFVGRPLRRRRRGLREASRSLRGGKSLQEAWTKLFRVAPTEAERYANRAARANRDYLRYRKVARGLIPCAVDRASEQLRIGINHKWGPQPFHYRDQDYISLVQSIDDQISNRSASDSAGGTCD